jgi:exonuclease SbcD
MKIAHFSDLHYGDAHLAEADRCFAHAIEQAVALGVDAAVISGDATDHALDLHHPAAERLARRVRELADHCPVLMLQGTYSHEPPGSLAILRLLGGRHAVQVAERIEQVALDTHGRWCASDRWCFGLPLPSGLVALFSCVPTVHKGTIAAAVGAAQASACVGETLAALLRGFAATNRAAAAAGVATVGVSHGTVFGCVSENGVPMAGFDHEFTSGALFAAGAQAFMLGHIHRHQSWRQGGQVIAYAGSIGRFHYGEEGDKGFLLWELGPQRTDVTLHPTPARRTVDLCFDGPPDLERLQQAAASGALDGVHVRVRWSVGEAERHQVDRAAIEHALRGAAAFKLEGRVVPLQRPRAEGMSTAATLACQVDLWAQANGCDAAPLLERLAALDSATPEQLAATLLKDDADGPTTCQPSGAPPAGVGDDSAPSREPVQVALA